MIKHMLISLIIISFSFSLVHAEELNSGFFANIEIGAGGVFAKLAGDEVGEDNTDIKNLTEKSDEETAFVPYLNIVLGYTNEKTGTEISLEKDFLDGSYNILETTISININQRLSDIGIINLSLANEKSVVWKDPYLGAPFSGTETKFKRKETNKITRSLSLNLSEIMETGIFAGVEFGKIYVDDDEISYDDLKRDGKFLGVISGYNFVLSEEHSIAPYVSIKRFEIDGKSNSNNEIGTGLIYSIQLGSFGFETLGEYKFNDYEKKNPIFHKNREDISVSLSETITFAEPFDITGTYLFISGGYYNRNSNINFYDSTNIYLFSGIGAVF